MSAVDRRFTFVVDEDVSLDIEECYAHDPDQAAEILVLIEETKGDHTLCELLVTEGHEDEAIYSVKQYTALQRQRYNAYTVRVVDADDWRLITAVDHRQRIIALLYIMRRDEDYDETVQQRVVTAYEKLGLNQLG
jgi:hypothetical protein